jgi:hypothetical protein
MRRRLLRIHRGRRVKTAVGGGCAETLCASVEAGPLRPIELGTPCQPNIDAAGGQAYRSNSSRILVASPSIAKGLARIAMPSSSPPIPMAAVSANPVMNTTFSFGRTVLPKSASWRPFIPPGNPTSVTKRSMRASERRICSTLAPSEDSIALYPSYARTSLTSIRTEGSSSTISTVSPAPALGLTGRQRGTMGTSPTKPIHSSSGTADLAGRNVVLPTEY